MTAGMFETDPCCDNWIEEEGTSWRGTLEPTRFDSQRVGMAAPRPIKGILKNKNSATNVKEVPDDIQAENPEQTPGLSEDDQQ